jgi:hypothetical protein
LREGAIFCEKVLQSGSTPPRGKHPLWLGPLDPTSAGIGIIEKYQIAVGDSGIAVLQALVK